MSIRWLTAMLDVPEDRYEPGCLFWEEATAMRAAGARGRKGRTLLMPDTGDAYLAVRRVSSEAGGCHLVLHVEGVSGGLCKWRLAAVNAGLWGLVTGG